MIAEELARAEPLLARYGYSAVFVAVFVEGIGVPAPGQTLLLAGAVLAARGEIALGWLLATATAASALGMLVGWAIGRSGGRRLLERLAGPRLARIEGIFRRFGPGLVALGRFVEGLRQLSGIAAGALGMELAPFLVWDVLGALLWTSTWGLGAYFFTRETHMLARFLRTAGPTLLIATAVALVGVLFWVWRGRHGAAGAGGQENSTPHGR